MYDFGDTVGMTPLVKMHTLGHTFVPAPVHAGGLRYHGMAPLVCKLYDEGSIEAVAVPQLSTFQAACSSRARKAFRQPPSRLTPYAWLSTRRCGAKRQGRAQTILFNLSGHGHFDLAAYEAYLTGRLRDEDYPEAKVAEALQTLPAVIV